MNKKLSQTNETFAPIPWNVNLPFHFSFPFSSLSLSPRISVERDFDYPVLVCSHVATHHLCLWHDKQVYHKKKPDG